MATDLSGQPRLHRRPAARPGGRRHRGARPPCSCPALAKAKGNAQNIGCRNNLKQIGLAYTMWASTTAASSHSTSRPTRAGAWNSVPEGTAASTDNSFRHFRVLSNYGFTPQVFVCPGTRPGKPAADFRKLGSGQRDLPGSHWNPCQPPTGTGSPGSLSDPRQRASLRRKRDPRPRSVMQGRFSMLTVLFKVQAQARILNFLRDGVRLVMNESQLEKMRTQPGFIAALDQSGGSTPKASAWYGIKEGAVVERRGDVRDRGSDAHAHHHQPQLHRRTDSGRDSVREHYGPGNPGAGRGQTISGT